MASKLKLQVVKMESKIISIEWPILDTAQISIVETIVGIVDLFKSQQGKDSVSIHQVIVGNKKLNGLRFRHSGSDIFLNYIDAIPLNIMKIFLTVTNQDALDKFLESGMGKTDKKKN